MAGWPFWEPPDPLPEIMSNPIPGLSRAASEMVEAVYSSPSAAFENLMMGLITLEPIRKVRNEYSPVVMMKGELWIAVERDYPMNPQAEAKMRERGWERRLMGTQPYYVFTV